MPRMECLRDVIVVELLLGTARSYSLHSIYICLYIVKVLIVSSNHIRIHIPLNHLEIFQVFHFIFCFLSSYFSCILILSSLNAFDLIDVLDQLLIYIFYDLHFIVLNLIRHDWGNVHTVWNGGALAWRLLHLTLDSLAILIRRSTLCQALMGRHTISILRLFVAEYVQWLLTNTIQVIEEMGSLTLLGTKFGRL